MALAKPKGLNLSSDFDSDNDDNESWWSGIFSTILSTSDSGWRAWSAMDLCHTREIALSLSLSLHFPSLSLKNFYLFQGQLLLKFQESFEFEMTFLCICCTVWLPRKWEKIEKKRKYFFIWIFNIIADVDVLMWNFLIPRTETRESRKGNPRKCWDFHFNCILVILIIE